MAYIKCSVNANCEDNGDYNEDYFLEAGTGFSLYPLRLIVKKKSISLHLFQIYRFIDFHLPKRVSINMTRITTFYIFLNQS